jgi:peroxiredoxin
MNRVSGILIGLIILLSAHTLAFGEAERVIDFTLPDTTGREVRLSDYHGQVVVLNFWATWCAACLEEIPSLKKFSQSYSAKGVTVIGISIDRKIETLRSFLKKHPLPYQVLHDPEGQVFVDLLTVQGLPATFIIDQEGEIREVLLGKVDFSGTGFRTMVDEILQRE